MIQLTFTPDEILALARHLRLDGTHPDTLGLAVSVRHRIITTAENILNGQRFARHNTDTTNGSGARDEALQQFRLSRVGARGVNPETVFLQGWDACETALNEGTPASPVGGGA